MVSALTSQLLSNLYETRNLAVMAWSHKKGRTLKTIYKYWKDVIKVLRSLPVSAAAVLMDDLSA